MYFFYIYNWTKTLFWKTYMLLGKTFYAVLHRNIVLIYLLSKLVPNLKYFCAYRGTILRCKQALFLIAWKLAPFFGSLHLTAQLIYRVSKTFSILIFIDSMIVWLLILFSLQSYAFKNLPRNLFAKSVMGVRVEKVLSWIMHDVANAQKCNLRSLHLSLHVTYSSESTEWNILRHNNQKCYCNLIKFQWISLVANKYILTNKHTV